MAAARMDKKKMVVLGVWELLFFDPKPFIWELPSGNLT